jgi:cellulose synthase/poly-beta-1,6-N-acetylglucosamine synthase-like glycosyltransferase
VFSRRRFPPQHSRENIHERFMGGNVTVPYVTVIVAAHNEEAAIETKIESLLASDYPGDRLEILIGSDGSSDRTEETVRRYEGDGVGLISFPMQLGKSAMQNSLVAKASGEVLIFTDADCICDPNALRFIAENFVDPEVGLVTAAPRYTNESENAVTKNESVYLRYESWIREQESARGVLAMASGSLFALRRRLWKPIDRSLGDDFVLPLRVAQAGMRNILERRANTTTRLSQKNTGSMFGLKSRIISKDFSALLTYRSILNPFLYPATGISLLSHKLLRWLVPYFMLGMLLSSAFSNGPLYRVVFWLQFAFYVIALLGFVFRDRSFIFPLSVPTSFCVVNLAALVGIWISLTGRSSGQWTPVREL